MVGGWDLGWDFNVIRFTYEKNKQNRITRSMQDFEEFVSCNGLWDGPWPNGKYTWTNGQTFCRLDRFLVSSCWEEVYPPSFYTRNSSKNSI